MTEALRLLARMMDMAERGDPEGEAHLRACGWEWISGRWRSPEEVAAASRCRHCGARFVDDEHSWKGGGNRCFGSGDARKHEAEQPEDG